MARRWVALDTRTKATLLAGAALALSAIVLVVATLGPVGPSALPAPGGQSGTTGPGASGPAGTAGEAGAKPSASPAASPEPPHDDTLPTAGWAGAGADLPPVALVARLAPEKTYPRGISPTASFTLTSLTDTPAAKLAAGMTADPPVAFTVKKGADPQVVTLEPTSALEAGRQYRFTLRTGDILAGSWVFQTAQPPRVIGTTPADTATLVPVETGIELVFDQDGIRDPSSFFSISPAVGGRFEQHGRAWVFVPERALAWATIYVVTVKRGVPMSGSDQVLADDVRFAFETVPKPPPPAPGRPPAPTTPPRRPVWMPSPAREVVELKPGEQPLIPFEAVPEDVKKAGMPQLDVGVHRFASLGDAIDAFESTRDAPRWALWSETGLAPTKGLPLVASFTAALEESPDIPGSWIRLPETLARGWYIVTFERDGRDMQVFLQVTDIATYVAVTSSDTLVWVNDVSGGLPVEGASVRFVGKELLGRTGADGIASGATPASVRESGAGILLVRAPDAGPLDRTKPGRAAFVPVGSDTGRPYFVGEYHGSDATGHYAYHNLLYIDRQRYNRTDQVDVWGLIRSRASGKAPPAVEIRLSSGEGWDDASLAIARETVKIDPATGTFIASIPFTNLPEGSYSVRSYVGGEEFASEWFYIEAIVKPDYRIAVSADRHVVIDGESVTATVTATFFEDTPAAGIAVSVGWSDTAGEVVTDASGRASIKAKMQWHGGTRSWYDWQRIWAYPIRGNEWEVPVKGDEVVVFPSAVWLESSAEFDGDRLNVVATTSKVDTSAIERERDEGTWDWGSMGGAAAGTRVTVKVTEITVAKTLARRTYDPIQKKAVDTYHWVRTERDLGTFRATTGSSGATTIAVPVAVNYQRHEVHVVATDAAGRATETTYSVQRPEPTLLPAQPSLPPPLPESNNGLVWPHLGDEGCGHDYWYDDYGYDDYGYDDYGYDYGYSYDGWYDQSGGSRYTAPSGSFRTGDPVQVPFRDRDGSLMPEGGPNRYLFFLSQLGLRDAWVQASPVFLDTFRAEWGPNVSLAAVRFTGRTYETAVRPYTLRYDASERELTVSVTTDEERYRPGGDAVVSVRTTDEDGRPVDSSVVLRVLDERLYAMGFVSIAQPLPTIYRSVGSGLMTVYATHLVPMARADACYGGNGGADTTGGGDDRAPWREDFRDSLLFARVRTGSDGVAKASFHLSDDLTTWRVTAVAVTRDLAAGNGEGRFAVGLPFFIDAPVSTTLVAGDRPSIRVRTFGTALTDASRITFTVAVPGLGMEAQTVKATGYGSVVVPLPRLTAGEHEVRITATMVSGGKKYQDALVRTMRVVATRLTDYRTLIGDLRDGLPQAAGDGWTTYVFSDAGRGRYLGSLYGLMWQSGDRVDTAVAAEVARRVLLDSFDIPADSLAPASFDYSRYQRDGGVTLLPYSSADLALSARVALAAPGLFNAGSMSGYFSQISDAAGETRERVAIALAGRAALGEDVLVRIQDMLTDQALTIREQLYLALGAAALGDHATAIAVEQALLRQRAETFGDQLRLRVGSSLDDTLEATALVALIAAIVGDPVAPRAEAYVEDNPGHDDLYSLQQAAFLDRTLDRMPAGKAAFEYTVGGKRHTVKLEDGGCHWLRLTPGQRAGLSVKRVSGEVEVAVTYQAPVDLTAFSPDPDVTLERIIVPSSPIPADSLVQVKLRATFGPQALERCYWVTDVVPSGLLATDSWLSPGLDDYDSDALGPWWVHGDRVSFCAWPNKERVVTMAYWARIVMPGTYRWEPAVMHPAEAPERGAIVRETTLTIR